MKKGPGTSVPGPFFAFISLRVICVQVPRGFVALCFVLPSFVNNLESKGRERRA